ncbi:hypothetical protein ACDZ28_10610 [Paenibacillus sp. RS8]|uniref:hypothetical protein n=1 Tax=Paenibacillus sp. RS8 TaxID=3242681 RepID=UPI0035BEE355
MGFENLEGEIRFIAQHAKHNLQMVKQQAEVIEPAKLKWNIEHLETLIQLHECEAAHLKAQKKNDRRLGQSQLRSRLKSLLSSILTVDRQKSKEEMA